jgi:hypothetical protein
VYLSAVQSVVVVSVLELLLDPAADLEPHLRRHRDIAAIEEAVNVAPEQKSVRDVMRAALGIGVNVRRVGPGLAG